MTRRRGSDGRAALPALVTATVGLGAVLALAVPSGAIPAPPEPPATMAGQATQVTDSPAAGAAPSPVLSALPAPSPIPTTSPTNTVLLPAAAATTVGAPTTDAPPTDAPPTDARASVAPSAVTRIPDRVDRSWPLHPPWDACPRPVWRGQVSTGLPGAGRRVLVIGDSLTRDSRVLSARGMRAAGWTPTFRCWGSTRLDWGLDQVARSRQLDQLPRFVVMALGTNDISWETPQTTERRVRQLLDRLGPARQVMWVDLHLTRSAWLNARADWFNGLLDRLARTHPNLTVVHWHKIARAHGIRGWDGIHYGAYGYRLRAATLVTALNALGREHPAAGSAVPTVPTVPVPTP